MNMQLDFGQTGDQLPSKHLSGRAAGTLRCRSYHPEDRARRERRFDRQPDAAAIGDVGLTLLHCGAEIRIEQFHSGSRRCTGRHVDRALIDEDADDVSHRPVSRKRMSSGGETGWGRRRRYEASASTSLMVDGAEGRPLSIA